MKVKEGARGVEVEVDEETRGVRLEGREKGWWGEEKVVVGLVVVVKGERLKRGREKGKERRSNERGQLAHSSRFARCTPKSFKSFPAFPSSPSFSPPPPFPARMKFVPCCREREKAYPLFWKVG